MMQSGWAGSSQARTRIARSITLTIHKSDHGTVLMIVNRRANTSPWGGMMEEVEIIDTCPFEGYHTFLTCLRHFVAVDDKGELEIITRLPNGDFQLSVLNNTPVPHAIDR